MASRFKPYPPLYEAVITGDTHMIETIIHYNEANYVDSDGKTALHVAVENGQIKVINTLLDLGCNVNAGDNDGKTALHFAVQNAQVEAIKLLLDRGRDVDLTVTDINDNTAIFTATADRNLEVFDISKENFLAVDHTDDHNFIALYVHALNYDTKAAKVMLERGCDKFSDVSNALHQAVEFGDKDEVIFFLDTGIDMNAKNNNMKTVLHIAVSRVHDKGVYLLLDKGCVVNSCDVQGKFALPPAVSRKHRAHGISIFDRLDIVKLLLEAGSDPNISDGKTALHLAVECKEVDMIHFLLKCKCNTNSVDNLGRTALYAAASNGHDEIIQLLLEEGCDVNHADKHGWTAFHCAAIHNQHKTVKLLLSRGAVAHSIRKAVDSVTLDKLLRREGCNVNRVIWSTAIHGHLEILNVLLECNPNLKIRDRNNCSILHTAIEYEKWNIVFRLLSEKDKQAKELMNRPENLSAIRYIADVVQMTDDRYKRSLQEVLFSQVLSDASGGSTQEAAAFLLKMAPCFICEHFLQKNPDKVNSTFKDGETALHCAIRMGSVAKCKLFKRFSANISLTWSNQSPLEYAISIGARPEILSLFQDLHPSILKDSFQCNGFVKESFSSCARRLAFDLHTVIDESKKVDCSKQPHFQQVLQQLSSFSWSNATELDVKSAVFTAASLMIPSLCPEQNLIRSAIRSLFEHIETRYEFYSSDSIFSVKIDFTGSSEENTKVYFPNELDTMWELFVYDEYGYVATNNIVSKKNISGCEIVNQQKWHSDQLYPSRLCSDLHKQLSYILQEIGKSNTSFGNLTLHTHTLQLRDKIAYLQLLWNGPIFKNMIIYVDLVFVFKLPIAIKPAKQLPLSDVHVKHHSIAKTSRQSFGDRQEKIFFYSYSAMENQFIQRLPDNIRSGYMRAKSLRIAAISRPRDFSGLVFEEDEKCNSEDIITTYMLKTCLFFLHTDNQNDKEYLSQNEFEWATRIYVKLKHCVGSERKLETFYGDGVLFQCVDHHNDTKLDRPCCQKKLLILRMCDAILAWLRENRAELQELQELYPCCRLEVYNRHTRAQKFIRTRVLGDESTGLPIYEISTKPSRPEVTKKSPTYEKLRESKPESTQMPIYENISETIQPVVSKSWSTWEETWKSSELAEAKKSIESTALAELAESESIGTTAYEAFPYPVDTNDSVVDVSEPADSRFCCFRYFR